MKILALKSAAGVYMIRRGGTYDLPDDVAKEYIRAGFAEPASGKRTVGHADETAAINPKDEKRGKKK